MNRSFFNLLGLQLTTRIRPLIIWVIVWALMGLLFVVVFNDLNKTADTSMNIYNALPKEVLETFNVANDYLTKAEKFLSGQFMAVYLIAGGVMAVFMGVGAIGGKIDDATITNYLTKPISRFWVYTGQALASIVFLTAASAGVCGLLYIMFSQLSTQETISQSYFLATFIGSTCLFISFALIAQLLGTIISKFQAQAIGCGLVVAGFFIDGLGALAGIPLWLQKVSLFYYFDTTQLRDLYNLNGGLTLVLLILSLLALIIGALLFRKKNIYI